MASDEAYMKRCLDLARNGAGTASPNPMVGACIVKGDRILAEAFHHSPGSLHGEALAIERAKDFSKEELAGATLYVNLEPCCHHGRTSPCTERILEAGIGRVVIGTYDPSEKVAGKGVERLKEGGCKVEGPVLESECRTLNRRFFTFQQKKRPYIILKWAQSLDGYVDLPPDPSSGVGVEWITGQRAQQLVHTWRAEEDAIIVGKGTAISDDPSLTVRHVEGEDPLRLFIDRKGELPGDRKLLQQNAPTLVLTEDPDAEFPDRVEKLVLDREEDLLGRIDRELYERSKLSLIVEGGTKLLNSYIRSGHWDEARVFIGARYFGNGKAAPRIPFPPDEDRWVDEDRFLLFRDPNG